MRHGKSRVRSPKPALTIRTCKISRICFASIFEIFSQGSWRRKLSRANALQGRATGNQTLFGACCSSISSMPLFFAAERKPSEKCSML